MFFPLEIKNELERSRRNKKHLDLPHRVEKRRLLQPKQPASLQSSRNALSHQPPLGRPPPIPPRNFDRSHSCPTHSRAPGNSWHYYHQNSANCSATPPPPRRHIGGIFLPSQKMQEKIAARWSRINQISFNYDVCASPIPHYQRNFFSTK